MENLRETLDGKFAVVDAVGLCLQAPSSPECQRDPVENYEPNGQHDVTNRFQSIKLRIQSKLPTQAGMAELADAADSKSADLRVLGVQLPLPAPIGRLPQANSATGS
jgi:hypothetical protein